jgi:hypothetical protein
MSRISLSHRRAAFAGCTMPLPVKHGDTPSVMTAKKEIIEQAAVMKVESDDAEWVHVDTERGECPD